MRFTLAAAALLAPSCSLPSLAQQDVDVKFNKSLLVKDDVQTSSKQTRQHPPSPFPPVLQRNFSMDGGRNTTRRKQVLDQDPGLRRQPALSREECHPDVGILECGVGMYCQPDQGSLLGGFCTTSGEDQHRKLYSAWYFDNLACGEYPDYHPFCNCDEWDNNTHTGTGTCYSDWSAFCFWCDGGKFCASYNKYIYQTEGHNSSSTSCVHFTDPYEQTFCFTNYHGNNGACKLELDGVACTSCQLFRGRPSAGPVLQYDCENVGMGSARRILWLDVIPPIAKEICGDSYVPLYDYCILCPNGFPAEEYIHTKPNVSGYDFDSCSGLIETAFGGHFNDTTCTFLSAAVQETCCGVVLEPFHCDICGRNHTYVVTKLNNTIHMNGTTVTCEELLFASENGWINESECEILPGLAAGACGCSSDLGDGGGNVTHGGDNSTTMLEETEPPTVSPGTIAPTDPSSTPKATPLSALVLVATLVFGIPMIMFHS